MAKHSAYTDQQLVSSIKEGGQEAFRQKETRCETITFLKLRAMCPK